MDKKHKDKSSEENYMNDEYSETTLLSENISDDYEKTTLLSEDSDYGETTLLSDEYNETTLLSQENENTGDESEYNETTLLSQDDSYNETSLLENSVDISDVCTKGFITNIISQKKTKITKTPFVIGSSNVGVDLYIPNPAVSRKHSKIIFNKNEYYIIDNNSTNHTIIDGTVIEPENVVKLYNGALIELADELFEFNIIKD